MNILNKIKKNKAIRIARKVGFFVFLLLVAGGGGCMFAATPKGEGKAQSSGKKVAARRVPFDYGRVAKNYNRYRRRYPACFYEHLKKLAGDLKGLTLGEKVKIIELGTGTGMVALGIAEQLGSSVAVTGVDISETMLQIARDENNKRGIGVQFQLAKAESTPYSDASFHIVIAARSWHWFNRKEAIREVKRILKPGGFFMIADYSTFFGDASYVTDALIRKYNPSWHLIERLNHLPNYARMFCKSSFDEIRLATSLDKHLISQAYWVKVTNTSSAIGANPTLDSASVKSFEEEHKRVLEERFGKGKQLEVYSKYHSIVGRWNGQRLRARL